MIKLLIADDSATVREFLAEVFREDPDVEVIGMVKDGVEALEFLERERPDVVTMDIEMPRMNGFEATRRIMETMPLPIVIVSGASIGEQRACFLAFEAGALAVVQRPTGFGHEDSEERVEELRNTVKAMAEVRVVRRWPKQVKVGSPGKASFPALKSGIRVVGIGASTGGPSVLKTVLAALPDDFPWPILLVQHMSRGFTDGFANWLESATGKRVGLAADGEQIRPGHVFVAPAEKQMGVNADGSIVLSESGSGGIPDHRPSISWLFRSLAESYGPAAAGILLTGMGRDGADAMKRLQERGAITIVQSAETCVVDGMPGEAVKLGAADFVLSPEQISAMLVTLALEKS